MCSLLGHMKHVVASVREGSNVYIAIKMTLKPAICGILENISSVLGGVPPQLLEVKMDCSFSSIHADSAILDCSIA